MTVKLKAGESVFALYNEGIDEYVYLGGGNGIFGFKSYPKPTGMAPTVEKLQKKHDNLLARLTELAKNGEPTVDNLSYQEIYDRMAPHFKQGMSFEAFAKMRERNLAHSKERWSKELAIAKSFIIVEISVKKV